MGISDIPPCRPYDLLCQMARRATKGAVYGKWAQENLVQVRLCFLSCSSFVMGSVIGSVFSGSQQYEHISLSQPIPYIY